ncbi:MAG: hypothetical protein ACREDF_04065 [Thermoplasmata archaeon]
MTCECAELNGQLTRRCPLHAKDYTQTVTDATSKRDDEWVRAFASALRDLSISMCPTGPDKEVIYDILKTLHD